MFEHSRDAFTTEEIHDIVAELLTGRGIDFKNLTPEQHQALINLKIEYGFDEAIKYILNELDKEFGKELPALMKKTLSFAFALLTSISSVNGAYHHELNTIFIRRRSKTENNDLFRHELEHFIDYNIEGIPALEKKEFIDKNELELVISDIMFKTSGFVSAMIFLTDLLSSDQLHSTTHMFLFISFMSLLNTIKTYRKYVNSPSEKTAMRYKPK